MYIISDKFTNNIYNECYKYAIKEFGVKPFIQGISLYSKIFDFSFSVQSNFDILNWILIGYIKNKTTPLMITEMPIAIGSTYEELMIVANLYNLNPMYLAKSI